MSGIEEGNNFLRKTLPIHTLKLFFFKGWEEEKVNECFE